MQRRGPRKLSSPTAELLRGSRVFSLPPPLPRPDNGLSGSTSTFSNYSGTATQHYPTYQAIVTPPSSLARGDWGFKRPLPLKATTRSSTPTMRIKEIDTIEHFTEFESASDHVKTLEKWKELSVPISIPAEKRSTISGKAPPHVSVFEAESDNTRLEGPDKANKAKWKYDGPWIAGMNAGEFDYFLTHQVRNRKLEFRQFLRDLFTKRAFIRKQGSLGDEGRIGELKKLKLEDCKLTDEEFEEQLRILRKDTTRTSELSHAISHFFDLPASSESEGSAELIFEAAVGGNVDKGPPRTHPSAGLSYLRSDALMENHPVLGPRENRSPVEGRILMSKTINDARNYGRIGVAGIVARLNIPSSAEKASRLKSTLWNDYGGPKVWVTVERASIDPHGRVELSLATANTQDVDVKQGRLGPIEVSEMRRRPTEPLKTGTSVDDQGTGEPAAGANAALLNVISNANTQSGETAESNRFRT